MGRGKIIKAEWDFDGLGRYPLVAEGIDGTADRLTLSASHTFDRPGVYYPAIRVWSHRDGSLTDPNRRIQNLGRIRIVVA